MLTYQVENLTDLIPELKEIIPDHHAELGEFSIPLSPDWDMYRTLDKSGSVLAYTVRYEGKLVGYYVAIMYSNIHYIGVKTSEATAIYMLPEYRVGFAGIKLLSGAEDELKKLGVNIVLVPSKKSKPLAPAMFRIGYKEMDIIYCKEV